MSETEDKIPLEAQDFKAPDDSGRIEDVAKSQEMAQWDDHEFEWEKRLKHQDTGIIETSIKIMQNKLDIPDSKDNHFVPGAREKAQNRVDVMKRELESRKNKTA